MCGLIVGSAIYSALMNDQYNFVITENYRLRDQLEALRDDINQSEKIHKKNAIKSIVPHIEQMSGMPPLDTMTETELKKRLKRDLDIFLGRSIYEIDSDAKMARKLLEQKIYDDIGDKDYELNVKTMLVVDGILQVWAEAKEHLPK